MAGGTGSVLGWRTKIPQCHTEQQKEEKNLVVQGPKGDVPEGKGGWKGKDKLMYFILCYKEEVAMDTQQSLFRGT